MFRHAIALILSLAATPSFATQEYILPTLFDLTGVAEGDVLNIRAAPDASSSILGGIFPGATRIEVIEERGGWGRVNTGERAGWVNMRYLKYRTDVWEDGTLPDSLSCFGTEPFWSLAADGDAMVMSTSGEAERRFENATILGRGVFRDPTRAVAADGLVTTMIPQICSDGMSDRLFGLRAELVLTGDRPRLLSGCCTIQPQPQSD
ncbi:SH3 domain-containing protein [Paracoccus sp. TK19116]|uniref:SH3 domain-containing protein n=1 Tax=Paracoccus albicereus TaxID=2922394 RepID=A0ABT1MW79_9RHOB|nr:SH3 domain-containing protein [Paracoccus albicereus]MCQ0971086.1 SH3 domain-containing protein [Paracoccus albicereus]